MSDDRHTALLLLRNPDNKLSGLSGGVSNAAHVSK